MYSLWVLTWLNRKRTLPLTLPVRCPPALPHAGQIAAVKAEADRLRSLPTRRRLGPEQLAWLEAETKKSARKGERPWGAAGGEARVEQRADHSSSWKHLSVRVREIRTMWQLS